MVTLAFIAVPILMFLGGLLFGFAIYMHFTRDKK